MRSYCESRFELERLWIARRDCVQSGFAADFCGDDEGANAGVRGEG